MNEYLDRRYALALYQIAEEKGKVQEAIDSLKQVAVIIKEDKNLQKLIEHPQVSSSSKVKLFENLFKDKIDNDVLSFLVLLIDKHRILGLEGILTQMDNIFLEKNNTFIAEVKTVTPLLEEERNELVVKLEKKYSKKIILKEEIDKSLLGGVYVKIDNEVIDGTVKSKIEEMKKIMLKRE